MLVVVVIIVVLVLVLDIFVVVVVVIYVGSRNLTRKLGKNQFRRAKILLLFLLWLMSLLCFYLLLLITLNLFLVNKCSCEAPKSYSLVSGG